MSGKGIHPNINSIIHMKELARSQLMKGNYEDLLYTLDTLMREIKTVEQDKKLKKDINVFLLIDLVRLQDYIQMQKHLQVV